MQRSKKLRRSWQLRKLQCVRGKKNDPQMYSPSSDKKKKRPRQSRWLLRMRQLEQ